MREMKDSGIPWVGKVPPNWEIMPNKYLMHKVKEICPVYNGENILSLTMQGVIIRDFDLGGKMPSTFDGYQIIYPGNLLMCLFDYDVTPRCIGLIKDKGLTSPAYSQFVMNKGADACYYYYYYLLLDFTKELLHLAKNLRHSFTEEQLGKIKIPVPPIEEQRRIADYLDSKCAKIKSIKKNVESEIEALKQYKQSVITEAVTKGLNKNVEMKDSGIPWVGKIPSQWKIMCGKYLFTNAKEIVGTKVNEYERLALTLHGVIKRSKNDTEGLQPAEFNTYQILRKNELVFKLIDLQNISTSRIGLSPYNGIVSPAYIILKAKKNIIPAFAEKYYLMMWMNHIFNALGDAGVRSSLNVPELLEINVPIPPIKEQQKISDYLDSKCSRIDSIIQKKQELLANLDTYKKSLIYEYVTGKKEVPSV